MSSDDLDGLRLVRDRVPATIDVAAGGQGCTPMSFLRIPRAYGARRVHRISEGRGAVQGVRAAACCTPQRHAHVGCAARPLRHVEHFFDPARLEPMLFDGALSVVDGALRPNPRPVGHGRTLGATDAEGFAV